MSLSRYELGHSGVIACQQDQRFGYALYVPTRYQSGAKAAYPTDLIISMHGSARQIESYRNLFVTLAEALNSFILAPLFPIGIGEPGNIDSFKAIAYRDIRFDQILISMAEEVAQRYHLQLGRKVLYGFSGGGQFAHRFAYLHPEFLDAVAVGAPGKVTMLDDAYPWWRGTADVQQRFGQRIDIDALRRLRFLLLVGAEDTDTEEIHIDPDSPLWMPGANAAGATRIERLASLERNLRSHNIPVSMSLVPGVAHQGVQGPLPLQAEVFFQDVLRQ